MAWEVVWEYRDGRWERAARQKKVLNKIKNSISRLLAGYKEKERGKETTKILYDKIKSFMDISLTLFSYGYIHIYIETKLWGSLSGNQKNKEMKFQLKKQ